MIQIEDKKDCCGCEACRQICPKHCISFDADSEGFRYPKVDQTVCIQCGLCEKVCPVINQEEKNKPVETVAAFVTDNDVRLKSSSGGIFTFIAKKVLAGGGVVFGAVFDKDWSVKHTYITKEEDIDSLRRSKYLQSRIGDSFATARDFLDEGKTVMFCATPCQIAGLKRFLRKDYPNLLAVDFVCHGVPSPGVWHSYLNSIIAPAGGRAGKNTDSLFLNGMASIEAISFRDKKLGWKKFGFRLKKVAPKGDQNSDSALNAKNGIDEPFGENRYMNIFLSNLSLRPSCYSCPAKAGSSNSDITLGDFWGIENVDPQIDDDKGCSLVMLHNPAAKQWIVGDEAFIKPEPYADAVKYNPSIEVSVGKPPYRDLFMQTCSRSGFDKAFNTIHSSSFAARLRRRLWLELSKRKKQK